MNKYNETLGTDISKDVFDIHGSKSGHDQFIGLKTALFMIVIIDGFDEFENAKQLSSSVVQLLQYENLGAV